MVGGLVFGALWTRFSSFSSLLSATFSLLFASETTPLTSIMLTKKILSVTLLTETDWLYSIELIPNFIPNFFKLLILFFPFLKIVWPRAHEAWPRRIVFSVMCLTWSIFLVQCKEFLINFCLAHFFLALIWHEGWGVRVVVMQRIQMSLFNIKLLFQWIDIWWSFNT